MTTLSKALQAAAGNAGVATYIEDVFSTYLYTGNGSTKTITNNIDLDGEGGMVWIKSRSAATDHQVFDTLRGATYELITNSSAAQVADADTLTAFNSNGFSLGADATINTSSSTYVSWTFRKAPKFFDIVTYSGTGSATTVAHSLGAVPGCIMVKRTDSTGDWQVYHRSNTANPETDYLVLNSTAATVDDSTRWNDTAPTSAVFSVGTDATVNASGGTYVAYLFAHNAGGFGADGTENVISCGSYTGNGSTNGPEINLGFEPQWVYAKRTDSTGSHAILDVMRGMPVGGTDGDLILFPNTSDAELNQKNIAPTPTGFKLEDDGSFLNQSGATYIYIAIRRGPMKTPEAGTTVFNPITYTTATDTNYDTGLSYVDFTLQKRRTSSAQPGVVYDRLRGGAYRFLTSATTIELSDTNSWANLWDQMGLIRSSSITPGSEWAGEQVLYGFRRAPGFMDVVCYTGTGSATTVTHNLGVAPELMLVKCRSNANDCAVYYGDNTDYLLLNSTAATADDSTYWNDTSPTSSVFSIGTNTDVNTSSYTYVAYLFATVAGVSKVGSYTGNGTNQTINCGFSAGARFVLIKRTDSTGDWYFWDSARGIVAGNDPHMSLNTTDVEVTTDDSVDADSSGFIVNQDAATNVNVSSATYIYLAIA